MVHGTLFLAENGDDFMKKKGFALSMMIVLMGLGAISANAEAEQTITSGGDVGIAIPYSIFAHIKPEYEEQAKNWDTEFLTQELGIESIYDVTVDDAALLFENEEGMYLNVALNLNEAEKDQANIAFATFKESEWFDHVVATWLPTSQEDISLPFTSTIEDVFQGKVVLTLVKFNFSEEAAKWDSNYINHTLGITEIKDVRIIFTEKSTGRCCVFFDLTDDTKETALRTAQKLYDTGWFYSVELEGTSEPGEELSSEHGLEIKKGDVNLDEIVDIIDVITLNKAILGSVKLSELQQTAADVNKDNQINSTDSLLILREVIGATSNFIES
jgi:hypothetical protein